jgi:predicted GIY-YIG superfamily endonuclease|tara:strand:+ start:333 stop:464 length:132 start_codon:yes stop_codon:yes gene_type:complete
MCESVQIIEFDIKRNIKDLSREDKIRYFEKLNKAIKDIKKLEL